MLYRASDLDHLKGPRQRKMDMRFLSWDIGNLCRTGSLKTAASEILTYTLDVLAVREVRCEKGGSQTKDDYIFFMEMGMLIVT
jgi:hypothetical protein